MSDPRHHTPAQRGIEMTIPPIGLGATLTVPAEACGIVLFAHGSGSSRFSPRNRAVAAGLNVKGFGTLLFDLLTREEEADRANVFHIPLLASRLILATDWLTRRPDCRGLSLGYFGASTGAAAALVAATDTAGHVRAIVSRGGRPDLAGSALPLVRAPTLLIVGGHDEAVIAFNREAAAQLRCPHDIRIVSGATHLFEEPGALEEVTALAADWFATHFAPLTAADT